MKLHRKLLVPSLLLSLSTAFSSIVSAVNIRIDYRYDTNNFFDTPEKRGAMEAVANFYSELLTNNLLRIDPAEFRSASWTARITNPQTGSITTIDNLIVPEDEIIVFVGSRSLPGTTVGTGGPAGFSAGGFSDWFERIDGRGNPNAAAEPISQRLEFATWGGSIAFDSPRNWNFSLNSNESGTEFIAVALHEMAHVLGIGTADAWENQIVNGRFTGPAATASNGFPPFADNSHFTNSLESDLFGSFSVRHGTDGPVLMLASSFDNGFFFEVITDLDLAALTDLGWQVDPEVRLDATDLSNPSPRLLIETVSFKDYRVDRVADLDDAFTTAIDTQTGTGDFIAILDSNPLPSRAFYRVESSDRFASQQSREASRKSGSAQTQESYSTRSREPVVVHGCCNH